MTRSRRQNMSRQPVSSLMRAPPMVSLVVSLVAILVAILVAHSPVRKYSITSRKERSKSKFEFIVFNYWFEFTVFQS
jgi:hypothetical protein